MLVGRKKIKIEKIVAPKNRQVTFNKRKVGLMKKAMELSILCDCDIMMIVFSQGQLYQYCSTNIDNLMKRYQEFDGPYEALGNKDLANLKPGKASSFKVGTKKRKRASLTSPSNKTSDDEGEEDEDDEDEEDEEDKEDDLTADGPTPKSQNQTNNLATATASIVATPANTVLPVNLSLQSPLPATPMSGLSHLSSLSNLLSPSQASSMGQSNAQSHVPGGGSGSALSMSQLPLKTPELPLNSPSLSSSSLLARVVNPVTPNISNSSYMFNRLPTPNSNHINTMNMNLNQIPSLPNMNLMGPYSLTSPGPFLVPPSSLQSPLVPSNVNMASLNPVILANLGYNLNNNNLLNGSNNQQQLLHQQQQHHQQQLLLHQQLLNSNSNTASANSLDTAAASSSLSMSTSSASSSSSSSHRKDSRPSKPPVAIPNPPLSGGSTGSAIPSPSSLLTKRAAFKPLTLEIPNNNSKTTAPTVTVISGGDVSNSNADISNALSSAPSSSSLQQPIKNEDKQITHSPLASPSSFFNMDGALVMDRDKDKTGAGGGGGGLPTSSGVGSLVGLGLLTGGLPTGLGSHLLGFENALSGSLPLNSPLVWTPSTTSNPTNPLMDTTSTSSTSSSSNGSTNSASGTVATIAVPSHVQGGQIVYSPSSIRSPASAQALFARDSFLSPRKNNVGLRGPYGSSLTSNTGGAGSLTSSPYNSLSSSGGNANISSSSQSNGNDMSSNK